MLRKSSRLTIIAVLCVTLAALALAGEGVHVNELVVAASIPESQRDATVKAAKTFYDFWNTGDESDLKRAIAPTIPCRRDAHRGQKGPRSHRASSAPRCPTWRSRWKR